MKPKTDIKLMLETKINVLNAQIKREQREQRSTVVFEKMLKDIEEQLDEINKNKKE